jgi:hypothetical protein
MKLLREFCSAYKVSHSETLRNFTNPSPVATGFVRRNANRKRHHKGKTPAGILRLILCG